MGDHFLYSTNAYMKQHVQERWGGGIHYVWCSEIFDPSTAGAYTTASTVASSSNPADIYRELSNAVATSDKHCTKITKQKLSFYALARDWGKSGRISPEDRDEMIFKVKSAGFHYWRPLIYVIPRSLVASRMKRADPKKCAGLGPEWIVPDLKRDEFDLIEFPR